jgi:hypothetical protein
LLPETNGTRSFETIYPPFLSQNSVLPTTGKTLSLVLETHLKPRLNALIRYWMVRGENYAAQRTRVNVNKSYF